MADGLRELVASTVNRIAEANPNGAGNLRRWIAALVLELMVPGDETRIACLRLGRGIYAFAELKRAWMLTMFLHLIDRSIAKGLQVHLIVDNYGTHTHPNG